MQAEKILKRMKQNKRDWSMKDITLVAKHLEIPFTNNGTSHYIFKYTGIVEHVNIPNHKDIHPDYITQFLKFIDKVKNLKLSH